MGEERWRSVSGPALCPEAPPLLSIIISQSLYQQDTNYLGPTPRLLPPPSGTRISLNPFPFSGTGASLWPRPIGAPSPSQQRRLISCPSRVREAHFFCAPPPQPYAPSLRTPPPRPHLELSYGEAATVPLLGAKAVERAADENGHCRRRHSGHLHLAAPCRGPQPGETGSQRLRSRCRRRFWASRPSPCSPPGQSTLSCKEGSPIAAVSSRAP